MSKPLLFISYSHEDAAIAEQFSALLKERGFDPWIDTREIGPGCSFVAEIDSVLRRASYLILLLSRHSAASRWVRREWMSSLARQEAIIIPVRTDDNEIPALLADLQYIDWRDRSVSAIDNLAESLRLETSPLEVEPERLRSGSGWEVIQDITRRQTRIIAQRCLTSDDLRAYLLDAQIDRGQLAGESLHGRIVSLVEFLARTGTVLNFAKWVFAERGLCARRQLEVLKKEDVWRSPKFS
jgi:hypothetical protein